MVIFSFSFNSKILVITLIITLLIAVLGFFLFTTSQSVSIENIAFHKLPLIGNYIPKKENLPFNTYTEGQLFNGGYFLDAKIEELKSNEIVLRSNDTDHTIELKDSDRITCWPKTTIDSNGKKIDLSKSWIDLSDPLKPRYLKEERFFEFNQIKNQLKNGQRIIVHEITLNQNRKIIIVGCI